jgi:tetratricopeptide (TPR) repeat protein
MEEIVQGYTVERELMRRGLRTTVLARETGSGKSVVVKVVVLPPGEAAANAARARHRHLVEKVQKLAGEEFVPILSWGEEAGKVYLIREHVVGMTLAEVLATVKRLPVELAGILFGEIVRAVQKAHAQGIAHLDLSQANIVFRQDGKLVFTDWVKEEEGAPAASPAAEGVQWFWQKADQNLDLFAMGILFAKVLVGEPGLGADATEAEIVVDLSQRLRSDPSISERMAKIIQKLLGEEFERYGGAEEVLTDLEGYIQQFGEFDSQVAWQRFLDGPAAFVEQLNQWKANQIAREAKELLEQGKVQEAKAEFERALAVDPECSEAEAELEFLAAKEGLSVDKLTAPAKPSGKTGVADILEKLRTSEPLTTASSPAPKAKVPEKPAPPVLEAGEEVLLPVEGEGPPGELFVPAEQSSEEEIPAAVEAHAGEEPLPAKESEIFSVEADGREVVAVEGRETASQPVTRTAARTPEARAAKDAPEVSVEETVPLVPLPEKPSEEEEKAGIGFGEAVAQLPVEEGREALEVPEKMGAEEYVALARGERKLPWKIFAFIGAGIVLALVAFFLIKTLNRPKEKEKDSEGLYQEALRAQEVGDFERALSKFDQVARQYSKTPRARFALSGAADLEWRLGRQDKALEHYRMVVSGAADDSLGREGRFHRALILREQKKTPEALEELAGFVMDSTAGSRTLEAQMIAAQLLHDQGLADSALVVYGKALSLDARRVYAVQMHKERGLIFEEKGDWKAARAEYDAILAMTQTSDLSHVWAEQKASAMAIKMMGKGR